MKKKTEETISELANKVYDDAIKPAAQDVGGIVGTLTGFIKNVVLYPLKKLNIKYEQKIQAFERMMQSKYENISEHLRCDPELHIVGPTMESLKYNILEDDLAELFANLLISDMDRTTQSSCSNAFVKIIEQLSPIDARVLKNLVLYFKNIKPSSSVDTSVSIGRLERIHYINEGNEKHEAPTYLLSDFGMEINDYDLSKSIINLQRLGLVDLLFVEDNSEMEQVLSRLIESSYQTNKLILPYNRPPEFNMPRYRPHHSDIPMMKYSIQKNHNPWHYSYFELKSFGEVILNDFGKDFARVCLREN